jgi:hypothetical protein
MIARATSKAFVSLLSGFRAIRCRVHLSRHTPTVDVQPFLVWYVYMIMTLRPAKRPHGRPPALDKVRAVLKLRRDTDKAPTERLQKKTLPRANLSNVPLPNGWSGWREPGEVVSNYQESRGRFTKANSNRAPKWPSNRRTATHNVSRRQWSIRPAEICASDKLLSLPISSWPVSLG